MTGILKLKSGQANALMHLLGRKEEWLRLGKPRNHNCLIAAE